MEKIIFDKNIQGLEHSIENGGMVFKLSGETSILPGTNLNMKIRLGQESIEDYVDPVVEQAMVKKYKR